MYVCRSSQIPQGKINLKLGKKLIMVPLGDIQGDEQIDKLDKFVKWCGEREDEGHTVRVFGTGDYFETTSPSERAKLLAADLHDTSYERFNKDNIALADDFVSRLTPLKGRIICLLQGHHWAPIKLGKKADARVICSDQYIAEKLGTAYAGNGFALISLLINGLRFRILAHHGIGTGRAKGGRLNKRTEMRRVVGNCHWYVMAHDNEKLVDPEQVLIIDDSDEISYIKQYFTGAGCIQQSYHMDTTEAGYAEQAMYAPAVLGQVIMSIEVEELGGKKRLDYHVSA